MLQVGGCSEESSQEHFALVHGTRELHRPFMHASSCTPIQDLTGRRAPRQVAHAASIQSFKRLRRELRRHSARASRHVRSIQVCRVDLNPLAQMPPHFAHANKLGKCCRPMLPNVRRWTIRPFPRAAAERYSLCCLMQTAVRVTSYSGPAC